MKSLLPKLGLSAFMLLVSLTLGSQPAHAYTNSRLMDDQVLDRVNSMDEQSIRNFINSRPSSCLATSGAIFPEPITYWQYGGNVDAARVIYKAAQYSGINPQVIMATLEKEQTLISRTNCYESSGIDSRNKAMGQGCFESGSCPTPAYAGFHQQVMKGAWQIKFNKERAVGNVNWGGNGSIVYDQPYTEGNRQDCSSCSMVFRDGYKLIDGQYVKLETGTTASLYRFTPHLGQAFPGVFERWFGPATIDAKVIQVSGDPRVFMQDGNVKHWVSTGAVYTAWGLGNLTTNLVTQSYLDSLPTGAELTRISQTPNGTTYYMDGGHKHWVRSTAYMNTWGLPSSQAIVATNMLDLVPESEWMGRFAKSASSGTVWLMDVGVKHKLPTGDDQYHWGLLPSNFTFMSDDALAGFTTGADLGENISFGNSSYVVDQSRLIRIPDHQTAVAWGISAFTPVNGLTMSLMTLGSTQTGTNFVQDPANPAWFMLTSGSKRYVSSGGLAESWGYGAGQPMTFVSSSLISKFAAAAALTTYVQESGTSKVYVVDKQKLYVPDSATFSAWFPSGTVLPTYDANALSRLTEGTASTVIQPVGSANVYALIAGKTSYILNNAILTSWGVPRLFPITKLSGYLAAAMPAAPSAGAFVTNGTTTYLLDNGYLHAVPAGLVAAWGAGSPATQTPATLSRFTVSTDVTPTTVYNGAYSVMTGGKKHPIGKYGDAYGVSPSTATPTAGDLFGLADSVSYIAQSTDSGDPRKWLVSGGMKQELTSFALAVSYGYLSRGVPVSMLDPAFLSSLTTKAGAPTLCIQAVGTGIKFLNFGAALGFPDGATLTNYCPVTLVVSDSVYNSFALTGSISRIIKDDSGKIYFIENGTKRWITSGARYDASYAHYPITYLYGTTISLIPDGAPIN